MEATRDPAPHRNMTKTVYTKQNFVFYFLFLLSTRPNHTQPKLNNHGVTRLSNHKGGPYGHDDLSKRFLQLCTPPHPPPKYFTPLTPSRLARNPVLRCAKLKIEIAPRAVSVHIWTAPFWPTYELITTCLKLAREAGDLRSVCEQWNMHFSSSLLSPFIFSPPSAPPLTTSAALRRAATVTTRRRVFSILQ